MMQYLAWYANIKRNFKSGKPSQTTNQKQQKPQKTQQQSLLLALPMLWLSVATLFLLFVCWLLLWVRLPMLSKQDNKAQLLSAMHAPLPVANPFKYPKAHSLLEMPEQSILQTTSKALTQTRTDLSNTTPSQAKWGITTHKVDTAQYDNQVFNFNSMLVEDKDDCVDIEICEIGNTRDNSDVVLVDIYE
jgi:hypothetical protein